MMEVGTAQMGMANNLIITTFQCLFYFFTNYILLHAATGLVMSNFEILESEKKYLQLEVCFKSMTSIIEKFENKDIVGKYNIYRILPKNPILINNGEFFKNKSYPIPQEYYNRYFYWDSQENSDTDSKTINSRSSSIVKTSIIDSSNTYNDLDIMKNGKNGGSAFDL
ncbi:hypothetical protein AYI68_g6217 [Smittium mucronatum]|uniref:Uncharacterized protein n=1 Tax=Smittium mucronatum TaxID=133383 RepID=A0A1R0GS40_9FUNG|nr:hypothetical protein AYI68_g6217 [Smittium mucronatum]